MSKELKEALSFAIFEILAAIIIIAIFSALLPAQQARYRQDGPALLPDAKYSPGDVAIKDKSQLCPVAHTAARRNVTEAEKKKVCEEYGVPPSKCNGRFGEHDHIVSLELGGSNDIKNIFFQPWMPRPGAHEKDKVENWTHAQVCSGKMTLGAAQAFIAKDWYQLYLKMKAEK